MSTPTNRYPLARPTEEKDIVPAAQLFYDVLQVLARHEIAPVTALDYVRLALCLERLLYEEEGTR